MKFRCYFLLFVMVGLGKIAIAQSPARPTPPPVPEVAPIVSVPADVDLNSNRVEDAIDDRVTSARRVLRLRNASVEELKAAEATLEERVAVEFVFSEQITQQQIDDFLAAGGQFNKVFHAVSYGWTGTLSADKMENAAASMGKSLLGILESKPIELHLDEATRTARVRPVWSQGVTGDGVGGDRVTVAILDTGVDATHTDLNGRMEYWKDWTSDNHASAQDAGHHGSHVAGIAVGSGAAYMANPTLLKYTDKGNFPTASGSFYPSPIHIPSSVASATWTSTFKWQAAAGVNSPTVGHLIKPSGWSTNPNLHFGAAPYSPYSFSSGPFTNPLGGTRRYGAYATREAHGGTVPAYVYNHTVSYGNVSGDAYSPMSGVSPSSRWAGFKVFTDNGSGNSLDLYEALDDLVANKATYNIKVANMSLGITTTGTYHGMDPALRNKTNTVASNGIVVVCSAGNSGNASSGPIGEVSDPGRAHYALTVASSSDVNQLTDYSSHGFILPGDQYEGDEDTKPDICAPGGSVNHQSNILSVDSNTGDGGSFADGVANDYLNIQGTSMAAPFIAGCAALVIDAMQQSGETWDWNLADTLKVKSLLLMTATETNLVREVSFSGSPVLNRGSKDINEGYGIVNADAAVEAYTNPVLNAGVAEGETFVSSNEGKRCWARRVKLTVGSLVDLDLDCPVGGDYDLYLYGENHDMYGNPVILASSTSAGNDVGESLNYNPVTSQTGYLVVKRVSGAGAWTLGGTAPVGISHFSIE